MSNHTYKLVEIVGTSPDGTDAAIRSALTKASETIKNMDWFEVVEMRGHIVNGQIAHYQVTLKVGFRVE
ncbi:dodecin domain-containing protein [Cupriavidus gilardii]|uniref:dodecin n=1 Tax=Cupriavidus gilardii TaxID=82541 RepID=UPI0015727B4A|nr:dodecin [Cupriavidus gilardii]MBO4122474.1 dodecin domain-containing protein [Cupriavidus gilardii]MCG5263219.1 dodecin family protein [Cupriavidus gilardii]MDF9432597.1 dodecin domain-containing protein [Cupriavidus gilardii]NSX04249.1 dodecin domain-containing protein [Cupriavidus gilardii]